MSASKAESLNAISDSLHFVRTRLCVEGCGKSACKGAQGPRTPQALVVCFDQACYQGTSPTVLLFLAVMGLSLTISCQPVSRI